MSLSDYDTCTAKQIREAVMECEDIDLEQKVAILATLDIEVDTERSFTITVQINVSAYDSDGTAIDEEAVHTVFEAAVESIPASDLDADDLSIEGFTVRED